MIQTVRKRIPKEELGITMSHEHLCVDLSNVRNNDDSTFGFDHEIIDEINLASSYGVKSYVEVSCNDMGRNVEQLKNISEQCDIHIIAATGFYLDEYHPQEIREMSPQQISEIFIKDLTVGIDETNIKAGVIGEVATSEVMSKSEKKVLQAAAIAANAVGCAITTHCQLGLGAMEQISIFEEYAVNPEKVILGHVDLSNNLEYMVEILSKGYNIGFDTIGKEAYLADDRRVQNLIKLLELGYSKQIVLSQDISRKSYFACNKKYEGYQIVMKTFIPRLQKQGVSEDALDDMLIHNPQRIFDIED